MTGGLCVPPHDSVVMTEDPTPVAGDRKERALARADGDTAAGDALETISLLGSSARSKGRVHCGLAKGEGRC